MKKLALSILSAAFLVSCQSSAPKMENNMVSANGSELTADALNHLDDLKFNLVQTSLEGEAILLPSDTTAYILFTTSNNQILGFGGCNSFSGGYKFEEEHLVIGPLQSTMMFCDNQVIEDAVHNALTKYTEVKLSGDSLKFISEGAVLATFVK